MSYGDMPPWADGPDQGKLNSKGYSYLENNFPNLSYISTCEIVELEMDKQNNDDQNNERRVPERIDDSFPETVTNGRRNRRKNERDKSRGVPDIINDIMNDDDDDTNDNDLNLVTMNMYIYRQVTFQTCVK
jgi:hypothetical protein